MNIGIDARLLSTPLRGTARYLKNLIKYLPVYDDVNKYFIFQYEDVPRENRYYDYILIKRKKLPRQISEHYWLNFTLSKLILKNKIDIFFTPYIFVPFYQRNWKNVITIHDALTIVCKKYYSFFYRKYLQLFIPPSIKRSNAIITVSESAKSDIIKYYNVVPQKISALHLWIDESFQPLILKKTLKKKLQEKYNLPEQFILFVSVLEERKNIETIIKVSKKLFERGINVKFVLVGNKGFGYNKFEKELNEIKDKIINLNFVEEEDLVLIYNLAKIFIFPTYYEGFGLPPLEAMKCGVPVIASNNSSMPEVVGSGGLLGDANNIDFFCDSIVRLLSDESFYLEMKTKALEQAKKFTAENHIKRLIDIFNNIE